jgi:hypothetical protein
VSFSRSAGELPPPDGAYAWNAHDNRTMRQEVEMTSYSVNIHERADGLVVARIPDLSRVVGYGLDQDEALFELCQALRQLFRTRGKEHRKRAHAAIVE